MTSRMADAPGESGSDRQATLRHSSGLFSASAGTHCASFCPYSGSNSATHKQWMRVDIVEGDGPRGSPQAPVSGAVFAPSSVRPPPRHLLSLAWDLFVTCKFKCVNLVTASRGLDASNRSLQGAAWHCWAPEAERVWSGRSKQALKP